MGKAVGSDTRAVTERSVEIPWLLERVNGVSYERGLDIGSADAQYQVPRVVGVDIRRAPKVDVIADADCLCFSNWSFALALCISTIEHIGERSVGYGTTYEEKKRERVMDEIYRVLAPGGRCLITAPFGKYGPFGFGINFDAASWDHLIARCPWERRDETYYALRGAAYVPARRCELADVRYCKSPSRAGAVVCTELVK